MSVMRMQHERATLPMREVITRCRNDIEAAWLQINAARALLERSRWLYERWLRKIEDNEMATIIRLPVAPETAPFLIVVDMPPGRRAPPSPPRARPAPASAGPRS